MYPGDLLAVLGLAATSTREFELDALCRRTVTAIGLGVIHLLGAAAPVRGQFASSSPEKRAKTYVKIRAADFWAASGNRTPDLRITSALLYQLS